MVRFYCAYATAAELAANFAVPEEFEAKSEFDFKFVNGLLIWAKWAGGEDEPPPASLECRTKPIEEDQAPKLSLSIKSTRDETRSSITGKFSSEKDAKAAIEQTRKFIETLVQL